MFSHTFNVQRLVGTLKARGVMPIGRLPDGRSVVLMPCNLRQLAVAYTFARVAMHDMPAAELRGLGISAAYRYSVFGYTGGFREREGVE